jgi:hypothetical protein
MARVSILCRCGRLAVTSPTDRFVPLCISCARGEMGGVERTCSALRIRDARERRKIRGLIVLVLVAVVGTLLYSGILRSEASEPRCPGESRAWMGEKLKGHSLAVARGGRHGN